MPRTDQQQRIVDVGRTGAHLAVIAGAGTGKTYIVRELARELTGRGFYSCCNSSTAKEARNSFPNRVHCSTLHAVARRKIVKGTAFEARVNDKGRMRPSDQAQRLGVYGDIQVGVHRLKPWRLMRLVNGAVRQWCTSPEAQVGPEHLVLPAGMDGDPVLHHDLAEVVVPLARRVWNDITNPLGVLPFSHDHYRKMFLLDEPATTADFVFVDEFQDTDRAAAAFYLAQMKHAQVIAVGDSQQFIYGWRCGAVDALQDWPADYRLPLTVSFRFGDEVAELANEWLELNGAEFRLTGNPAKQSRIGALTDADAVLCRTNAGVMCEVIKALERGQRVALAKKGEGEEIARLCQAAIQLKETGRTNHPELFTFGSWLEVQDYAEEDTSGSELAVAVRLIDEYSPERLLGYLRQLSRPEQAQLVVVTVHGAKGLQWPRVRIGEFAEPTDVDGLPAEPTAEDRRLAYVAVTRAEEALDPRVLAWHDKYVPTR